MTAGGWIFMLASLAFVYALATWCYYRLLRSSRRGSPRTRTSAGDASSGADDSARDQRRSAGDP